MVRAFSHRMNLDLNGKVILVTGGGGGIGEAIVRTLAIEGATPVILDRKPPESCGALLGELDIEHVDGAYLRVELTDERQVCDAVRSCVERFESIDGVVNNAGVNDGAGLDSTPEAFRASLEKNLVQCFSLVHCAAPHLRQSAGGALVNIGSKVAFTGQGGTSGYAAAKGGLAALTREWALDLAKDGVRVNAVIPAEVWTPMYDDWLSTQPDPAARRREIESRIPLGRRMTEPREIADMVAFLLSPRSAHTTGQLIHVDGGYTHFDRAYRG